jgi:hypothetical protein
LQFLACQLIVLVVGSLLRNILQEFSFFEDEDDHEYEYEDEDDHE